MYSLGQIVPKYVYDCDYSFGLLHFVYIWIVFSI